MAGLYVDYTATGANDGSSEANAFTSALTALAAAVLGDWFIVSYTHTESAGNFDLFKTGTSAAQPYHWISTDFATGLYRKSTINNFTGVTTLKLNCLGYLWGLNLEMQGTGAGGGSNGITKIIDGSLRFTSTLSDRFYQQDSADLLLINSDLQLGSGAGQGSFFLGNSGRVSMQGGTIVGNIANSYGLVDVIGAYSKAVCLFEDVDASGMLVGTKYLIQNNNSVTEGKVQFINCKMPEIALNRIFRIGLRCARFYVELINSNVSGEIDHYRKVYGDGSTVESDTAIYLDDGFTQPVTGIRLSHKITTVPTVNSKTPIQGMEIVGFAKTTGAKTLRVQVAHDFTNLVKIGECFITSSHFGTASSSHATLSTSSSKVTGTLFDPVSLGADAATSSKTWTGAVGLTLQQLDIPLTINEKGYFTVQLSLGKYEAGKVLRYDPSVEVI